MPLFKVGVAAMLALLLAACSEVSFYWQAGMGQLEIIGRRRPIRLGFCRLTYQWSIAKTSAKGVQCFQ